MKLDNIVYDIDSLRNAIVESWLNDSPTFTAMYPSETTTALANVFAGYGSFLQFFIVSSLANIYIDTCYTNEGVYQLAVTLGNVIHGNNSAQVLTTFTKENLISTDVVIPAETSFIINNKKYFNPHGIRLPAGIETVTDISLTQGEVLEVTKTTSGIPYERFYFSSDFKLDHNYIKVYVNGEQWSVADNFLDYDNKYALDPNLSQVVVLRTDSDGRSFIKVGDGQFGSLPIANSTILIHFVSNNGSEGNTSEIGLKGQLENPLTFTDPYGNQEDLKLSIVTTSTSYGGFDTQSIDVLRMTSPWVYASGHRAIRRQDYIALLDNQCGYLSSNVWGEYEEASNVGAYDPLMMNMVYYTGLKSFQSYPYTNVGSINNNYNYIGVVGSNKGFYGSYNFKIVNKTDPKKFFLIQDTGAKGFLFINDDNIDPRDSLLPDWQASLNPDNTPFFIKLDSNYIFNSGAGYQVGDVVYLGNGVDEINLSVLVTSVNKNGSVEELKLQQHITDSSFNWQEGSYIFNDVSSTGNGSNLAVKVITSVRLENQLVRTNDATQIGEVNRYPIENARSNVSSDFWYMSTRTPSLQNPIQIVIDYSDLIGEENNIVLEGKGVVGVKFQATTAHKFIGSFAMYGSKILNPSYENIRNSDDWDRIIDMTFVERPSSESNNWTNWYPTNCLKYNKQTKTYDIEKYYRFVIEFYSTEKTAESDEYSGYIHLDKFKLLYEDECSYIDYFNNSSVNINFPTVGSPGVNQVYIENDTSDENEESGAGEYENTDWSYFGYLVDGVLNQDDYLLYKYDVKIEGINIDNGYRNGNVLAYSYIENGVSTTFLVKIVNITNGIYTTTIREEGLNDSLDLLGHYKIDTTIPLSLDDQAVYTLDFQNNKFDNPGEGYRVNDIITLDGTDSQIVLKTTAVDEQGAVLQAVWMSNLLVDTDSESVNEFIDKYFNATEDKGKGCKTIGGFGTYLTVNINMERASGNGETLGQGGTIKVTSKNNIEVWSSFVGNRIDDQNVNYLDQPIIEKSNHFTTYLEFVQPRAKQLPITIDVSLSTEASITNNNIIQNVKNNVYKLFDITPDYLGKDLKLSDIYTAVMSTPNVKWCKVLEPIDNINVNVDEFLVPTYITINEVIKEYK